MWCRLRARSTARFDVSQARANSGKEIQSILFLVLGVNSDLRNLQTWFDALSGKKPLLQLPTDADGCLR